MPVTVEWVDDAHSILLAHVADPWTWDDLFAAGDQASSLVGSVSHPVALVNDFTGTSRTPPNPITRLRELAEHLPTYTERTYMVGIHTLLGEIAVTTYSRVFGALELVPTLEEAYQRITARRGSS
ncbi:MAG: hypothetical protein JW910_13415 [Anaerolineae bacterium]|nr:hypothetical protein [Anaerolineae bacterium]